MKILFFLLNSSCSFYYLLIYYFLHSKKKPYLLWIIDLIYDATDFMTGWIYSSLMYYPFGIIILLLKCYLFFKKIDFILCLNFSSKSDLTSHCFINYFDSLTVIDEYIFYFNSNLNFLGKSAHLLCSQYSKCYFDIFIFFKG